MGGPERRGPRALKDVLNALVAARGFGRLRGRAELEDAWRAAVGEPAYGRTALGALRRGVLTVTVAHPALLEELAAFRKTAILDALRRTGPGAAVRDIRFRIGPVANEDEGSRTRPDGPGDDCPRAGRADPGPTPGVIDGFDRDPRDD